MQLDEKLIKEIKSGNADALDSLIKQYYSLVFSYVCRKIGDYHMAYDITQEVFIKMMKSIHTYKHKGKFTSWLLRIAVNHCNDFYRKTKKKETVPIQDYMDLNNDIDIAKDYLRKDESERIKNILLELPDYQRDVIILRFYHDMKLKEIAKITQSKEATVKSRLRQGLSKLAVLIEGGKYLE